MNAIDARFPLIANDTKFAARSSNPIDRRLDFSAYFLATIQTLEAKGMSYSQIKEICLEIVYDYVAPKNKVQRWLKTIPPKVVGLAIARIFLKRFNKKLSVKGDPEGFRAEILTDKAQTLNLGYGVNILECGICKLFQKHDAAKYSSILCEVDKITSGMAGLELIRTGTIALGADKCDFRWKRI